MKGRNGWPLWCHTHNSSFQVLISSAYSIFNIWIHFFGTFTPFMQSTSEHFLLIGKTSQSSTADATVGHPPEFSFHGIPTKTTLHKKSRDYCTMGDTVEERRGVSRVGRTVFGSTQNSRKAEPPPAVWQQRRKETEPQKGINHLASHVLHVTKKQMESI